MSFLKIKDPVKRVKLIKEYLVRKKLVRDRFLAERVGDIELQQDLGKFFRPITKSQREVQEEATKKITEELGGIREKTDLIPQIKEEIGGLPQFIKTEIRKSPFRRKKISQITLEPTGETETDSEVEDYTKSIQLINKKKKKNMD